MAETFRFSSYPISGKNVPTNVYYTSYFFYYTCRPEFVEVLCSLAMYDNLLLFCTFFLFSLPAMSAAYSDHIFPYTVPYLYPATNTFMTCSIYMTAAVGVNRYLDIIDCVGRPRVKSGYLQAAVVLFIAGVVNVPRWLEFEYKTVKVNETGEVKVVAGATELRLNDDYVRNYTLITSNVLVVFVPTLSMILSTLLISREMMRAIPANSLSDSQEQARYY